MAPKTKIENKKITETPVVIGFLLFNILRKMGLEPTRPCEH